jgi:hypothetical protein
MPDSLCPILSKFGFCIQIFVKVLSIKFHGSPANGNLANTCGQRDRQMDGYDEGNLGAFRDCANTPNNKRTRSYVKILLLNLQ